MPTADVGERLDNLRQLYHLEPGCPASTPAAVAQTSAIARLACRPMPGTRWHEGYHRPEMEHEDSGLARIPA